MDKMTDYVLLMYLGGAEWKPSELSRYPQYVGLQKALTN